MQNAYYIMLFKWGVNLTEIIALISVLMNYKKIKNTYWAGFAPYLFLIVVIELTAKYAAYKKWLLFNIALYNYAGIPLQFLFFYWIFYNWLKPGKRIWPVLFACLYLAVHLNDLLTVLSLPYRFLISSYTTGTILLVILVLMYFYEIMRSNEILHFKTSIMFWVCTGLISFYLLTLPFFGLRNIMYREVPEFFYVYLYISIFLTYLMYIFFSIAFTWGKTN